MMNFILLIMSIIGLIFSVYFLTIVLYDKFKTKRHPNPNPFVLIAICHIALFVIFIIKLV